MMNEIVFCLAQNIAYYYGQEKNNRLIWELFLSMDVLGFNYWGIKGSNYEILNGINGTSDDFFERCSKVFGLRKEEFAADLDDIYIWEKSCMIVVDDYYLPYHPFYQKHHNNRFVVTVSRTDNLCTIYDMEEINIVSSDLEKAAKGYFYINGDIENIDHDNVNRTLLENLNNREWREFFGYIPALLKFRDELIEKKNELKENDMDNLYFFINKLGGPTQTRKYTADALENLAVVLGLSEDDMLCDKIQTFKKLDKEWDILGSLFFKAARIPSNKLYERILSRLENIISLEASL